MRNLCKVCKTITKCPIFWFPTFEFVQCLGLRVCRLLAFITSRVLCKSSVYATPRGGVNLYNLSLPHRARVAHTTCANSKVLFQPKNPVFMGFFLVLNNWLTDFFQLVPFFQKIPFEKKDFFTILGETSRYGDRHISGSQGNVSGIGRFWNRARVRQIRQNPEIRRGSKARKARNQRNLAAFWKKRCVGQRLSA